MARPRKGKKKEVQHRLPKFGQYREITHTGLYTDEDGVMWWVDIESRTVTRAAPVKR